MGRQRAGWWLAALVLHLLAWAGLQQMTPRTDRAPDQPPVSPVLVSEIILPPPPTERLGSLQAPPRVNRQQTRPTASDGPVDTRSDSSRADSSRVHSSRTDSLHTSDPRTAGPSGSTSPAIATPAPVTSARSADRNETADRTGPAPSPTTPTGQGASASAASAAAAAASGGGSSSPGVSASSGVAAASAARPSAPADAGTAQRPVSGIVQGPRLDASWQGNEPPPYPLAARRRREEGTVRLDLRVEADGSVSEVRLRQSSGSALLDRSVMQTVRHWRFIPARQDGQAIAAWYQAWEWVFRLEGGS